MQLKTKKRIAKEVLFFLGSVLLSLIIFLLVYPFNWYCSSKSDGIQKIIDTKTLESDSLLAHCNPKLEQQQWFYEQNLKEYDQATLGYNNYVDLWIRLELIYKDDSIEVKYNKTWDRALVEVLNKNGFHNAQMFKEFVGKNILTQIDKANKSISDDLQNEIVILNSKKETWVRKALSNDEKNIFAAEVFFVLLILLYPVRFLFWLIVWSFRTLKQKGE